jgi:ABC-type multidrug transport system fused ATPase/permease subunit
VTIAHRLSTAEGADEVLVFESGRLVERGHPATSWFVTVYSALYRLGGRHEERGG